MGLNGTSVTSSIVRFVEREGNGIQFVGRRCDAFFPHYSRMVVERRRIDTATVSLPLSHGASSMHKLQFSRSSGSNAVAAAAASSPRGEFPLASSGHCDKMREICLAHFPAIVVHHLHSSSLYLCLGVIKRSFLHTTRKDSYHFVHLPAADFSCS